MSQLARGGPGLVALAASCGLLMSLGAACTHTYTPEELAQEEIRHERAAREELEYDRQVEEAGGENAEALRRMEADAAAEGDR